MTYIPNNITQDSIVRGKIPGVTSWNKFGYRDNLTAAGGEQIVWASTATFTPMSSAEAFKIAFDSSVDGSTTVGAKQLTFYYNDANNTPAVAAHSLGSTGSDTTSFTGLGINRIAVSQTGSLETNSTDITITAAVSSSVQAIIPALGSVTQQCIYHVGSSRTGVAKFLTFNVNKLSGSNPKVTVKGYVYNRGASSKYEVYRHTIDTQAENTVTINEPIGFRFNPQDILYFVADTDQNNTVISMRFSLNDYDN